ncbi:MAG: DUF4062 domain-containing protein [Myxococcales bacterium]
MDSGLAQRRMALLKSFIAEAERYSRYGHASSGGTIDDLASMANESAAARSALNRMVVATKEATQAAGLSCLITVRPPRGRSGLIHDDVDVFEQLFTGPYDVDLVSTAAELAEKALGVYQHHAEGLLQLGAEQVETEQGHRKYTIFISSTYEDLKEQRDLVAKAILEMGHIPVGMEMFSAADEEQWKIIQRAIDDSDYYVVVLAHRYGSLTGEISYTEKEYDYAAERGIPCLGFILRDDAPWPHNHRDPESAKVEALKSFKKKVERKPVGYWKSQDELHGKVAVALMKAFNAQRRPGWCGDPGQPTRTWLRSSPG